MLVIPLLTGGAVGHFDGGRLLPVFLLTLAVLALFWLRTALESLLGTGAIRVQTVTVEERQNRTCRYRSARHDRCRLLDHLVLARELS
jgi:hypothetical protein